MVWAAPAPAWVSPALEWAERAQELVTPVEVGYPVEEGTAWPATLAPGRTWSRRCSLPPAARWCN